MQRLLSFAQRTSAARSFDTARYARDILHGLIRLSVYARCPRRRENARGR
jgi:hypothetical protein